MSNESTPTGELDLWLEERHHNVVGSRFRVSRVLFSGKSDFQQIDVVETAGHGRMLLNDGLIMLTERDEFIYHDMITHVPLFTHPNPRSVLVIGGGDGGTAREVLRHPGVETVTMVEIDPVVVEACRAHIPQTSASLDDPRLTLLIQDGVRFVRETDQEFDVIIIDSTDPIGPATPLFGLDFYRNVFRVLGDGGIVIAQGESPFYEIETQKAMLTLQSQLFDRVHIYCFSNMSYPGGYWSFTFASKGPHPIRDLDPARVEASGLEFGWYSADVHRAAFSIPAFMQRELGPVLSDL